MKTDVKSILAAGLAVAVALGGLTMAYESAAAKKIYRCVDDKKNVTVSDTPCVDTAPANTTAEKAAPADAGKKDAKGAVKTDSKKDGKPDGKYDGKKDGKS